MKEEQEQKVITQWFKYKEGKYDGKFLVFWQFLAATIIILFAAFFIADSFMSDLGADESSDTAGAPQEKQSDENCNVIGLNLHGEVVDYISPSDYDTEGNLTVDESASENIVGSIQSAENDDSIKAIVMEVDSYGGSPVAGEEIAIALRNSKKPTVAFIRGAGDSAAYWAATGAGRIYASKNSDVGSIGVTMSYVDASKQNKQQGLTYNQLSSGTFKDTGSSDKPLTADEKNLLLRDINIVGQNFIKAVSENRKLGIDKVTSMADGSTMLGEAALKNGLIDQIGGIYEVKQYLKDKIGAEPQICW
ncbi:MAG: S49 family peptidase [Candidatus Buchananbacteria bacterium]|jgi:signal peptide peptidase SppA